MPRNLERDEFEEERRRVQIRQAGFDLFSSRGIESVSLQSVADKADVGIATLYKYYSNKTNLVIAISARVWELMVAEFDKSFPLKNLENMNAYQLIEVYTDAIIWLYTNHPRVLCFSGNYKSYINREGATREMLATQLKVLKPLHEIFYRKYNESDAALYIRKDLPEEELYTTITLTMLGMAERYALGIVWADYHPDNYLNALRHNQEMLLNWIRPNN